MKPLALAALVCLASGCGGSTTAPTPPVQAPTPPPPLPTATITLSGNLTYTDCRPDAGLLRCAYQGIGENTGEGCAQNVRGTTKTWSPKPEDRLLSTTTWTYPSLVKGKERFTYQGDDALVLPEVSGTYATEFVWENVRCP